MAEIRKHKFQKMRQIKQLLQGGPKTRKEIEEKLYPSKTNSNTKRKTLNYLVELREIGDVILDEELYFPATAFKQNFQGEAEYKLALEHSRKFLLQNEEYDMPNPFDACAILASLTEGELKYSSPLKYPYFAELNSHLKTGYFREIWLPLEEYRKLLKKYSSIIAVNDGWVYLEEEELFARLGVNPRKVSEGVPKEDRKRIEKLQVALLKELHFIIGALDHDIPLRGSCRFCPTRSFRIRDSARSLSKPKQ